MTAPPGSEDRADADPSMPHQATPAEIEQAIERSRTKFADQLRAVSKELGQLYTAEDVAKDEQFAEPGLSAEAAERELIGEQPGDRAEDQADVSAPAPTQAMPVESLDQQAGAAQDRQTTAHVPHVRIEQAQRDEIDLLSATHRPLQAENEVYYERGMPWRERYGRLFSYQTVIIIVICAITLLVAFGIVWLNNPGLLFGVDRGAIAVTASPIVVVANSRNPAAPATTSPQAPAPSAAPVQAATTIEEQLATPVTSARQTPTLAAPRPAPAATEPPPITGSASAEIILLQVAEAEAALRTGQLEATITFGSGPRSSARIEFDLGDEQHVPRFQIMTTYEGTTDVQTAQRITIGDQAWERQQDNQWTVVQARESALKQLQVFLPRIDSISDPKDVTVEGTYVLHWYDAARDADVTLRVSPAGIPQQLRRFSRANGLALTVTYSGWNTPVDITRPNAN